MKQDFFRQSKRTRHILAQQFPSYRYKGTVFSCVFIQDFVKRCKISKTFVNSSRQIPEGVIFCIQFAQNFC